MIEQVSIDVTNYCDKGCWFCYNQSSKEGQSNWTGDELLSFLMDCVNSGVKSISFGGGEPLSFKDLFKITRVLSSKAFVSVTTNGLLLDNPQIFEQVICSGIDKIHITIHFPEKIDEVERVINQIIRLQHTNTVLCGVNLLVSNKNYLDAGKVYKDIRKFLLPKNIILVPMRYKNTPSLQQLSDVSNGEPFQSPSCLLKCSYSKTFCSVSYDQKVNWCSYALGKEKLESLDYAGLEKALNRVVFRTCDTIPCKI